MAKIPFTVRQKSLLGIAAFAVLAMWAYMLINYGSLPDEMIIGFDTDGQVSAYGNKAELFRLPAIGTVIVALLPIVMIKSEIWNLPVKTTKNNEEFIIGKMRDMMATVIALLGIGLFYIQFCMINSLNAVGLFLPMFLGVIVIVLLCFYLYICIAAKKRA